MFGCSGKIVDVVPGKSIRGAFGPEPAIMLRVQRDPSSDFTDQVYIPETRENLDRFKVGVAFNEPVTLEAVPYKGSAFLSVKANPQGKA